MGLFLLEDAKRIYVEDKIFYNQNDFELSLLGEGFLGSTNDRNVIFNAQSENLNWFELGSPSLYLKSLSSFINYLTYYLIMKTISEDSYSVYDLEKYFTDQIIAYLSKYSKITSKDKVISSIFTYWKSALKFIESFFNLRLRKDNFIFNSEIFFTCLNQQFKANIPLLIWDKNQTSVECFLLNTYTNRKPSWYSLPSIYKIINYYRKQNLNLTTVHLYRFDMSSNLVNPSVESIPMTKNVLQLADMYGSVCPYPFSNIFDKNKSIYYNTLPLNSLLKDLL